MKPFPPDQLADVLIRHLYEATRHRERLHLRLKEAAEADPALERLRLIALQGLEDARHQLALAILATSPGAPHAARRFGRFLVVASEDPLGFGRPTLRVLMFPRFAEELVRGAAEPAEDLAYWPAMPPQAEGGPEAQS